MNKHVSVFCLLLLLALAVCMPSVATPTAIILEPSSTAVIEVTTPAVTQVIQEITPTPEAFIPLKRAIPYYTLSDAKIVLDESLLTTAFPAGCSGQPPACTAAKEGYQYVSVSFKPLDLPEGQMLPYKSVPTSVAVKDETGNIYPFSLRLYDNTLRVLRLGFEVPAAASSFTLQWPGEEDTLLNVTALP